MSEAAELNGNKQTDRQTDTQQLLQTVICELRQCHMVVM